MVKMAEGYSFHGFEGIVNELAEVRFQRRSFEQVTARFYEMLAEMKPGPYIKEKVATWIMETKATFMGIKYFEESILLKKEIEREEYELRTILTIVLECRERES